MKATVKFNCTHFHSWKSVINIINLLFLSSTETENAANALNGRWFGGRVIKAEGYDELKFGAGDLSG